MRAKLRIPKRGWTLIHLALLLWSAWIAAGIVDAMIAASLVAPAPSPGASVKHAAPAARPAPDYSYILKRNIFNSSQRPGDIESVKPAALAAPFPGEIPEDAPRTTLELRLIGTVTGQGKARRFAAMENTRTGEQGLYKKNDTVLGAVIVRIERNRVYFARGEAVELLEVDFTRGAGPGAMPAALAPSAAQMAGADVKQVSEGEFMISKRYLDSQLKNMSRLLTEARAIPNIGKDGTADGFKVFSIKKGSIFDKAGLQNHDVIKRINGIELDSAEKGLELFQALRNETNFEVDLVRQANKMSLRFSIQ